MYLDALKLLDAQVGFGSPGLRGALGYESKSVTVKGRPYEHAVSAHAPSRLSFDLGRRFAGFRCRVALNDDVPAGRSHADFELLADGRRVALEPYVGAGEPPREMHAALGGAERLELVVRTSRWEYCHAVWLDPQVIETPVSDRAPASTLLDCLRRVEIELPPVAPRADRCIATVVSPGFEGLLDDMLGSLVANGGCPGALLVVFGVEADDACRRVAESYGATFVRCSKRANINPTVKSVLYTVARVVDASQFICLDADMLVLGDLRPVFGALEACPPGTILACREANSLLFGNLEHALCSVYGGRASDLAKLLGHQNGEGAYPLVVNDGFFAAGRTALLALDGLVRGWEGAPGWVDERGDIWWRNQFVFNLALAHTGCGVELDAAYNVQLNWQDADVGLADGRIRALFQGARARVLHFNGQGRHKYPDTRGLFAGGAKFPVEGGNGDGRADARGDRPGDERGRLG